jgi:very-short-patch-repair endonuclease
VLRSRALIVAGDPHQLAPTSLFAASATGDRYPAEEAERPETFISLLDTCLAAGMPTLMLRWHYRSRHESLFTFANAHFYAGQLATFPTASTPDGYGVTFEHVPHGTYDRRGTHTNQIEAACVADLVCAHVRATPDRSLGVVTFNQPQQRAIMHILEQRYVTDASLAPLFSETGREAFFVKDLEHVQGDTRDVVIISVGYGRDPHGNLMMHFGALNQQGGERRLNVAITRAREHVCLVSSLLPEEIDLSRARYPGPRLLRAYLEYVQQGGIAALNASRQRPQAINWQTLYDAMLSSPAEDFPRIEDTLAEELARNGLLITRQVGHSAMQVDIAIGDPHTPGRYLLGIASDGSDYYAAPTAHDRLREEMLAARGWKLHRIWSAAWLADAEAELSRILDIITRPDSDPPPPDPAVQ